MNKNTALGFGLTLVFVLLFLVIVKAFNIYYPVKVINTTTATELSVVGEGKVDVVPDTAYIDLGITVANAATVEEAQSTINKTNNAIIEALQKLNVRKEDVKTSNYSIYPNQTYDGNTPRTTGYSGNVTVTVKAHETEQAGQIIEAATKAGANQVQGTRFVVENPEKYREEARTKAINNAKEQGSKLAKDLGIKLGRVVNIVEYSPGTGGPMPMYDMAAKQAIGGGGPAEFQAGSQTITSVVTLYFEKK